MSLSFIEKAVKIHGDRYDYSLVEYKNSRSKVKIICKTHGIFEQKANGHLDGRGCKICSHTKVGNGKKLSNQEFIERAIKIHSDNYDYSLVEYKNIHSKIKIICKTHGVFEQKASGHLEGKGCKKCRRLTTDMFIEKCKQIHGENTYDYSLLEYQHNRLKVKIICKTHGEFLQSPKKHLSGNGCPKCTSKSYSKMSIKWLNSLCIPTLRTALSPEGEYTIPGSLYKADGYCAETNTIYEFHGDYWHGNPKIFYPNDFNTVNKKTFGELYNNTIRKKEYILSLGYNYVEMWESDYLVYIKKYT